MHYTQRKQLRFQQASKYVTTKRRVMEAVR